jgi:hypothetical protein
MRRDKTPHLNDDKLAERERKFAKLIREASRRQRRMQRLSEKNAELFVANFQAKI